MSNPNVSSLTPSIRMSRVLVAVFTAAVAFLDIRCLWLFRWASEAGILGAVTAADRYLFLGCLFGCSIPAYLLLLDLHRLLKQIQQGQVFTPVNVALLKTISRCCFAAAALCLVFGIRFPVLLVITAAAGFVGLIVRIVRNAFEQALSMKAELDLTV